VLDIKNLHVTIDDKHILQGLNLSIQRGEIHVVMGPNGSGKSTLVHTLAGRAINCVTDGTMHWFDQDLNALPIDARAALGIFLAFQHPLSLPGVTNIQFLKASVNAVRCARQQPTLDAIDFLNRVRSTLATVGMDETFLYRQVNEGFSGGEKKRNEVLQMLLLEPQLILLDETDSGLDIDGIQMIAEGVNAMRDGQRSMLIVTHYVRLLDYINPDFVHLIYQGRLVKTGDKTLAAQLDQQGYRWLAEIDNPQVDRYA